VAQIDSGSKFVRARAYLNGNLSPTKHAVLAFDTLLLDDGLEVAIDTVVKGGIPNVTRRVAGGSLSTSRQTSSDQPDDKASPTLASRARGEIRQRTVDAVSEAKQKVRDTFASLKSLREPLGSSRRPCHS
jgi:hypothetical protein